MVGICVFFGDLLEKSEHRIGQVLLVSHIFANIYAGGYGYGHIGPKSSRNLKFCLHQYIRLVSGIFKPFFFNTYRCVCNRYFVHVGLE